MKIKGVWVEDAHTLQPLQWVNIWDVDVLGNCTYYATCQVIDVPSYNLDEDYALEPIEDEGAA